MPHLFRCAPLVLICACTVAACHRSAPPADTEPPQQNTLPTATESLSPADDDPFAAVKPGVKDVRPGHAASLTFSHDDFEAAVERAKQGGKLVFVDAWAEWCHTCLSMDSVVLSDPALGRFQADFEFVALDTEKPVNEAFFERFEMDTWPTFFVVHPRDLELIGYWPGAGSVREMQAFLEQSLDTRVSLEGGAAPEYLKFFLAARSAQSSGRSEDAAKAYQQAYEGAPENWSRRSELLLGYLRVLLKQKRFEECAAIGKKHLDDVEGAARPAQFAQRYFTCLGQLRSADRNAEVERALAKLDGLAYKPNPDMSFDDQVDALWMLAKAYSLIGRNAAARKANRKRLAIAEAAAAKAESPAQAQAFDRVRALAYVDVGREQQAIGLLSRREKELPHGYAAPSLLAEILQQVGRKDEALEALERAIQNSEGPRQVDYMEKKARWFRELGRGAHEVAELDRIIEALGKLRGQSSRRKLQQAAARRKQLASELGR